MKSNIISYTRTLILAIVLVLGLSYVSADYTNPASSPPTCAAGSPGCDAPINTGSLLQQKSGGFQAGYLVAGNSAINSIPETGLKLKISAPDQSSYLGFENTGSSNKMWQIYPNGNNLVFFENVGAYGSGGSDRFKFESGGKFTATGDVCTNLNGGKCLSNQGSGSSVSVPNCSGGPVTGDGSSFTCTTDIGTSGTSVSGNLASYYNLPTGAAAGLCYVDTDNRGSNDSKSVAPAGINGYGQCYCNSGFTLTFTGTAATYDPNVSVSEAFHADPVYTCIRD